MKLGPLSLVTPMHSNGTPISGLVIAALHWRWSVTWRWSLVWSPPQGRRWFWPRIGACRTYRGWPSGWHFSATLFLPLIGRLHLSTQPNMPWRR